MSFYNNIENHISLATVEVTVLWSCITIALYFLSKRFYRHYQRWWTTPIIITPALLITITVLSHTEYTVYISGTHWLIALLGPATVAFAIPIYHQRHIIHRYWRTLIIGILGGSSISIISAWLLATALSVDGTLRLSLLPRSISTPFAMTVSGQIGGTPALTAVFVIITGISGAVLGELILHLLPVKSKLARGFSFGLAAHAVGSNKAHQIGKEEGAVAGLTMVLTGIFNVLIAPLLEIILRAVQ